MATWLNKLKRQLTGFLATESSKYITTESGLKIQIRDLGRFDDESKNTQSFNENSKSATSFSVKAKGTNSFTERSKNPATWPDKIKS